MTKSFWVAFGIVGVIGAIVLILTTGGEPASGSEDRRGDVTISEGERAPENAELADIVGAVVRRQGTDLVFEATMGESIPKTIRDGSLEFRWDISEAGIDTWIVSANVNLGPTAAVTSQRMDYGASTIDDSLPGAVEIDGATLRVILQSDEIDGFPSDLTWRLKTMLDADRADPASAVATDSAPESGEGTIEG